MDSVVPETQEGTKSQHQDVFCSKCEEANCPHEKEPIIEISTSTQDEQHILPNIHIDISSPHHLGALMPLSPQLTPHPHNDLPSEWVTSDGTYIPSPQKQTLLEALEMKRSASQNDLLI